MRLGTTKYRTTDATGATIRAGFSRGNKGDPNGTQKRNAYGFKERRIYPTREIASKVKPEVDLDAMENDFPPLDEAIPAETAERQGTKHLTGVEDVSSRLRIIAEEMMKPLLERLQTQEQQLQDQSSQLKLQPKFQKHALKNRNAVYLKTIEAADLAKQIEALQTKQAEDERAKAQVACLEEGLELQKQVVENEIQRLAEEKDAVSKAFEQKGNELNTTVSEMEKSWWKKVDG